MACIDCLPQPLQNTFVSNLKNVHRSNPVPWKPTLDPDAGPDAFMPRTFEKAINEGHFDKSVKVISGVNSEEGLIVSSQFHKSPQRWNLLWDDWERWAPMILFNREAGLITEKDREKIRMARGKFFNVQNDATPEISGKAFLGCACAASPLKLICCFCFSHFFKGKCTKQSSKNVLRILVESVSEAKLFTIVYSTNFWLTNLFTNECILNIFQMKI